MRVVANVFGSPTAEWSATPLAPLAFRRGFCDDVRTCLADIDDDRDAHAHPPHPVALPLAAGVLAPVGVVLSPAVGAVFMSLSTIIVAVNARRLRYADLSVPA